MCSKNLDIPHPVESAIKHNATAQEHRDCSGQSMPIDYGERGCDFPTVLADTCLSGKTERVGFGQPTVAGGQNFHASAISYRPGQLQ